MQRYERIEINPRLTLEDIRAAEMAVSSGG